MQVNQVFQKTVLKEMTKEDMYFQKQHVPLHSLFILLGITFNQSPAASSHSFAHITFSSLVH